MKKALIEVLDEGELVLGSPTAGQYMIRFYEDEKETGGSFRKTLEEAEAEVLNWEEKEETD